MAEELTQEQIQANEEALLRHDTSLQGDGQMPAGLDAEGNPIVKELIGGKFENQEALLQAYQELEKKQGSQHEEGGDNKSPTEHQKPVVKDDGSSEVSEESFLNSFNEEYEEKGELSEDSYKKLADKGYSKGIVNELIEARVAKAEVQYNKVVAVAGTEDQYKDLVDWAKDNLDDAQKQDYNSRIASGQQSVIEDAVNFLLYKREQSGETPVTRIKGSSFDTSAGVKPFKDMDELRKAHANSLYGTNKAYTKAQDDRYLKSLEKGTLK